MDALYTQIPHIHQKQALSTFEFQVRALEEEYKFCPRLLHWCLGCQQANRSAIAGLQTELINLGKSHLPALREKLDAMRSAPEGHLNYGSREMADLRVYLYSFEQSLQQLKSKIFQCFSNADRA